MTNENLNQPSVSSLPNLVCDCGGELYEPVFIIKRVPMFITNTGKDEYIPMPIFACKACGLIPSGMDTENIVAADKKTKISTIVGSSLL